MTTHDFSSPDTTFYHLVVADVQRVAVETCGRELTNRELHDLYWNFEMDWYDAIQSYLT